MGSWLGGYADDDDRRISTLDGLGAELGDEFALLHREDVPFVIREHARKFEFVFSELSVWRRAAD